MIAQYVTFGASETVALCVAPPNRATPPEITLEFPSEVGRHPISRKESRRTFAGSARYSMRYRSTLRTAAEMTELRIWLNQLKTQTVALPLWVDACAITAYTNAGAVSLPVHDHPVRYGAEWIIMNADASLYEIVEVSGTSANTIATSATTLNWPAGSVMMPLVFGHLEKDTKLRAITPSRGEVELRFKESSPYERRLNLHTALVGNVGAGVPSHVNEKLWLVHPVWSEVVDLVESDVEWEALGFGREEMASSYTSQPVRRGLEMEFRCKSRKDIAAVETFFADRKGRVSTFFIPTFRNDLQLTANAAIGADELTIAVGEWSDAGRDPHQGDPYIAAIEPIDPRLPHMDQTDSIEPLKIDVVAGGTLELEGVTALAHTSALTRISHLLLVRLVEPQLQWTYGPSGAATTRLKFLELPNEYEAPSTVLDEDVFLYRFVEESKYPRTWLLTSYEESVTLAGGQGDWAGTYTPTWISHGSIRRSCTDPDANKLTIRTGSFSGNPLQLFFPFDLEGRLKLYVGRANAADLTQAVRMLFSGEVAEPNPALTEATCRQFGNLYNRKVPNFILSSIDNQTLFAPANGLDPEDYLTLGNIAFIDGTEVHVSGVAGLNPDDWYKHGWLEIGTTPTTFQSRAILDSDPIVDGVKLILDRPLLRGAAIGNPVTLYPGYNGSIDQLEENFGARNLFGGHPYVPDTPPNIKGVKAKDPAGGKK